MTKFGFHKTPPLLALLTDFGNRDSYVGTMKGVIYSICEDARIVDLTHGIAHQDVTGAAFALNASCGYFPRGTIFVCVVDPGVGSERDIICMEAGGKIFLAPDNGLLSLVEAEGEVETIRAVNNRELWLNSVSNTFHGRDIFAPVAAHLAAGEDIKRVGPVKERIGDLHLPRPVRTPDGELRGEVIYVDQFGNLITNVGSATLHTSLSGGPGGLTVNVGGRSVRGVLQSYSEAEEGELLALIGSTGYLEIAANKGSAAEILNCGRGAEVALKT